MENKLLKQLNQTILICDVNKEINTMKNIQVHTLILLCNKFNKMTLQDFEELMKEFPLKIVQACNHKNTGNMHIYVLLK